MKGFFDLGLCSFSLPLDFVDSMPFSLLFRPAAPSAPLFAGGDVDEESDCCIGIRSQFTQD
jgi:hypothetical protein